MQFTLLVGRDSISFMWLWIRYTKVLDIEMETRSFGVLYVADTPKNWNPLVGITGKEKWSSRFFSTQLNVYSHFSSTNASINKQRPSHQFVAQRPGKSARVLPTICTILVLCMIVPTSYTTLYATSYTTSSYMCIYILLLLSLLLLLLL